MGVRKDGSSDPRRERVSVRAPQSNAAPAQSRDGTRGDRDLARLLAILPDAVAVCRDNAFVYVNDALVALLGYREEAEVLLLPVDVQVGRSWRSWSTKARSGAVPERWRRADGKRVFVEVTLSTIDEGGVIAVARDVTERWQQQVEAQQAERLAAIGTLTTSIAHQVNNPLAYLITNANFLHEEIPAFLEAALAGRPDDEVLRRRADEIRIASSDAHHGAQRVAAVIRELRSLARGADPAGVRNVDLHTVLDAACAAVAEDMAPRATLKKVYGAVPPLPADAARLEQVFVNLLGNAAQAIPEGAPSEHVVTVTTGAGNDGSIVVSIRDTGAGIPTADAGRVFDPFFTTRPLEGAGLGLTTALAIVRGMGGNISVDGADGGGTVFTVQLPDARLRASAPPRAGVARVLLVEQDRRVGEALRRAIGKDQDVILASTAQEALELLERGEFDLILCDVVLSDASGLELFERVEQRRPELAARFIFMAGAGLGTHMKALLEQSARPSLRKPIDVKELRKMVRERSR